MTINTADHLHFFPYLFDYELIQLLVTQINRYAHPCIQNIQSLHC